MFILTRYKTTLSSMIHKILINVTACTKNKCRQSIVKTNKAATTKMLITNTHAVTYTSISTNTGKGI